MQAQSIIFPVTLDNGPAQKVYIECSTELNNIADIILYGITAFGQIQPNSCLWRCKRIMVLILPSHNICLFFLQRLALQTLVLKSKCSLKKRVFGCFFALNFLISPEILRLEYDVV